MCSLKILWLSGRFMASLASLPTCGTFQLQKDSWKKILVLGVRPRVGYDCASAGFNFLVIRFEFMFDFDRSISNPKVIAS